MKTILVTGASGNLGQAIIHKFLKENHRVVGTVMGNDKIIARENLETYAVDLSDESQAQNLVDEMVTKYGNVDGAVLTVGGFAMGKIVDTKLTDIGQQIRLNFETTYNIARPVFLQMMKQGYGKIFMIGSKPGIDMHNSKGMVAYGLSKSLIFRLAELFNDESKGTDVIAHVIVPSTIDTPQNRKSMPVADYSKWVKAEMIAEVIHFYATDIASVIREPVIKIYNRS